MSLAILFSLVRENVRLAHAHDRMEHHGDERKLALDLSLEIAAGNGILNKLGLNLKDSFYMQDEGAVQDMINPDHKPKLRNPQIANPIKLDIELPCVRFAVIEDGTNEEEIIFLDAKCNKFEATFKEGGTVILKFRIQKSLVDADDLLKLKLLQEEMIKVNLESQEVEVPAQGGSEPSGGQVLPLFAAQSDENDGGEGLAGGEAGNDDDGSDNGNDDDAGDDNDGHLEGGTEGDHDALYDNATAFVRGQSRISISSIKREFKCSQLVAARILTNMQAEGIVGEAAGNGVREVFALPAASA